MRATQIMNYVLPSPVFGEAANYRGAEVRNMEIRFAVILGEAAARHYNQLGTHLVTVVSR
jgi:hypothetical protein